MSRRAQAGYGVYGVKLFDFERPEGRQLVPDDEARIDPDVDTSIHLPYSNKFPAYSNKTVAVFVLDIRSNKDPWQEGAKAFQPDYEGDFLGEHQWEWLETSLKRSRAAVNVIVNGLQVHSNLFPSAHVAEKWANFPRSQQRLFDAILQDNVQAPILVSGDVHMTQFMRKDCRKIKEPYSTSRPLIEMTTSGMTHS
jgi:alkaline phosphatase D